MILQACLQSNGRIYGHAWHYRLNKIEFLALEFDADMLTAIVMESGRQSCPDPVLACHIVYRLLGVYKCVRGLQRRERSRHNFVLEGESADVYSTSCKCHTCPGAASVPLVRNVQHDDVV